MAVMSFHIWQDKYGSDLSVIGASYQINGHPFTVIGVAAPGFYGAKLAGGGMPDFWLPATTELLIDGATARLKRPNGNFLDLIGRVRPGVNPKSLEAKLKVEFLGWLASHVPDMEPGEKQLWHQQTLHLIPGGAGVAAMRDQYQEGLKLLLIAAGCVLLVACANLANLMLARGLKDRAQTSIRVPLGASRGRLVRKALVESVMLAMIGGALGIGVAYAGTRLILYLAFRRYAGPTVRLAADARWHRSRWWWRRRQCRWCCCRPRLCWVRACEIWSTRISGSKRRAGISPGLIQCWAITSRTKWSRCSDKLMIAYCKRQVCGWWHRLCMRP